jgi:hypothetical protein
MGLVPFLFSLSACYAHTDFVTVEPIRYVPIHRAPNSSSGWVTTDVVNAERFRVRIGDLTYKRIIEPYMIDGKLSAEVAITALATFAEQEVVKQGFCTEAVTPADSRKLIGSNTPPEMWISVVCVKKDGA